MNDKEKPIDFYGDGTILVGEIIEVRFNGKEYEMLRRLVNRDKWPNHEKSDLERFDKKRPQKIGAKGNLSLTRHVPKINPPEKIFGYEFLYRKSK